MNTRRHTHTHTHSGILRSQKNNEILLLATVWMNLDGTTLSEISQRKANMVCYQGEIRRTGNRTHIPWATDQCT